MLRAIAPNICCSITDIITLLVLQLYEIDSRSSIATMGTHIVAQFRHKFAAASLILQVAEPVARTDLAKAQCGVLLDLLKDELLNQAESHSLQQIVMTEHQNLWPDVLRVEILQQISLLSKRRRRAAQHWQYEVLNVFTPTEWARWKENGQAKMMDSLFEMIGRMKCLGAKNIDEDTKKLLGCCWLVARGDWQQIGMCGRAAAITLFKNEFGKAVRHFEPQIYLELLSIDALQAVQPLMFDQCYSSELPSPLPPADVTQITMLDSVLKCRGTESIAANVMFHPPQQPQQHQLQLMSQGMQSQGMQSQAMQSQAMQSQQPAGMMQTMQPMFQLMQQMFAMQQQQQQQGSEGFIPSMRYGNGSRSDAGNAANSSDCRGRPMRRQGETDHSGNVRRAETFVDEPIKDDSSDLDGIDAVKARMLARGDDDDDAMEEDADESKPLKRPAMSTPLKTPAASTPLKKATPPKKASKPSKMPTMSWERTRQQVMCRNANGSCMAIKFKDCGGSEKAAWKQGELWLKKAVKEYEAS
jgi:hypothetical protein